MKNLLFSVLSAIVASSLVSSTSPSSLSSSCSSGAMMGVVRMASAAVTVAPISIIGGSGFVGDVSAISGRAGQVGDNVEFNVPMNASLAEFISPTSVVGDPITGSILVSDSTAIRNISNGMTWIIVGARRTSGYIDGPVATARLAAPCGLRLIKGGLYFCDSSNNVVRKLVSGVVSTVAGSTSGVAGDQESATSLGALFNKPSDLEEGPDGSIYVADNANDCIRRIAPSGAVTTIVRFGGMQPLALKSDPTNAYLAFGCIINGVDTIGLYFYGNQSWRAIATAPAKVRAMDFDADGNLFFPTVVAFYVLYKEHNWQRGLIVEGTGYANGEYPSAYIAPLFRGVQAFARVRGYNYVFAEGAANYLVRAMTIYPELTVIPWEFKVNVPNIPAWNATWMAAISAAVYQDFIDLIRWNSSSISQTTPHGLLVGSGGGAVDGSAAFPPTVFVPSVGTLYGINLPVFLNNYTTRLRLANYSWPRVTALVNAYYSPVNITLPIPAMRMPISPYSNPFATNNSAVYGAMAAVSMDMSRVLWNNGSTSGSAVYSPMTFVPVADGNYPQTAGVGGVDAFAMKWTVPGLYAYNSTAAAIIQQLVNTFFAESNAVTVAQTLSPPSPSDDVYSPSYDSTITNTNYTAYTNYLLRRNAFQPLALAFPNPMPFVEGGGEWPIYGNDTMLAAAAAVVIKSLGMLTGANAANNFGMVALNNGGGANGGVGANGTNSSAASQAPFTLIRRSPTDGSIILYGSVRGPLQNSTTTALLQQQLTNVSSFVSPADDPANGRMSAPAQPIVDFLNAYNAPQVIKIHFDAASLPFRNNTFMGPIMAAFGQDIADYFGASPLYGCCVHVNTSDYTIIESPQGVVVFSATIPGMYHNDSASAAFANRNFKNTSAPLSPFVKTLAAIEAAGAPRTVSLHFDLEGIWPGVLPSLAFGPLASAINFPINNATAIAMAAIGAGLARDIADMIGLGDGGDSSTYPSVVLNSSLVDFTTWATHVSVGGAGVAADAFSLVPGVSAVSGKKVIALQATIPVGTFNDTTNAMFAQRSAAIAAVLASAAGNNDASSPAVYAAIATAYPHMAAALRDYYSDKQVSLTFTPAGDMPLFTDPLYNPATSGNVTAPAQPSHMANIYAAMLKDVMRAVKGNIYYPTDPNNRGNTNLTVVAVEEVYSPDYEIVNVPVNRTVVTRISTNSSDGGAYVDITSYVVEMVPTVVFKVTVPGPFYNDSTLLAFTPARSRDDGILLEEEGMLDPAMYPSVHAYVSATTRHSVTFTPASRWPLDNMTRMFNILQLLVEDAQDYFKYSGDYLSLVEKDFASGGSLKPVLTNVTQGSTTVGAITWSFDIPNVCFPLTGRALNLSYYNFPKTTAALDPSSDSQQTTWRGMAPEPAFFGDSCGQGCVIGIAVGAAAVLTGAAVAVVVIASKRKRRADVVSPNFNPVMNGKIGLDLDEVA